MSENTSGKFPSVFGFIAESERIALQKCVLETSEVFGSAVEIGSLQGLSALLILSVLDSSGTLICIDSGNMEKFRENMQKHDVYNRVVLVNKDFKEECVILRGAWFSFVFIDHSHTYEDNIAAFEKFWPLMSAGGILAFHDYHDPNWADGTRAIDELIQQHKLTPHIRGGSFISFRKDKI